MKNIEKFLQYLKIFLFIYYFFFYSRVLIDELNMHKSLLSVQYNDCTNVIQRLLGERSKIAKELIQTHR